MAEIINLQHYKNMKDEEKKRKKLMVTLSNRCTAIENLLHSIDDSIGISFTTKHFREMNQIVGKEHPIDNVLCGVIVNALSDYRNFLSDEIAKLNKNILN